MANFGVKVAEFTFGENARQRAAEPTPANTPRPLKPWRPTRGGGATVPAVAGAITATAPLAPPMTSGGLEWSVMVRPVKWILPVLTLAVVLAIEALHSHYVARHVYPLTEEPRFRWILIFIALIWVTSYAAGLPDWGGNLSRRVGRALAALVSADLIISILQLFTGAQLLPRFVVFVSSAILVPVFVLVSGLSGATQRRRAGQDRVIAIIGGEESDRLRQETSGHTERPAQLMAVVRVEEVMPTPDRPRPLVQLLEANHANLLVLDREAQEREEIVAQAAELHSKGVRIRTLSLFYDVWLGKLPVSELERISLLFDINEIHRPTYARSKRFLDLVVALVGMLALALVVPIVAIVDLFGNRGPLFYSQPRVGKDGVLFTIHKFRTMPPADEPPTWTAVDDPRLGKVGRLLRRLHIDELPQMWNVLRRDLSIVGPRPEQPHYVETLTKSIPFYDVRHLVRPGITGWAQVNYDYGATDLDALEKLQYEFFYLRHQSVGLDLRIIGRTLRTVFENQGR
jgi:lipopolysaccharide/colanic/teichoic acid biosynthesis glycosyltransferase